jgi:hypothetical protein
LCPTWTGAFCIVAILFILVVAWFTYGESYLEATHRLPADILVVEGWIGCKGIRAAVDECRPVPPGTPKYDSAVTESRSAVARRFERGGYRYIVASGCLTSGGWEDNRESYAEMAAGEMIRLGVPKESVIVAHSRNTKNHRTFESAVATWRTLRDSGIKPIQLNVFTFGPHAGRSALVFTKVYSGGSKIGVIGRVPAEYDCEPWWLSSERARQLLEETVGYVLNFCSTLAATQILLPTTPPTEFQIDSTTSQQEETHLFKCRSSSNRARGTRLSRFSIRWCSITACCR